MNSNILIVAAVDDLMFQSKIRTIAQARDVDVPVRMLPAQVFDELKQQAEEKIVVVDLEASAFDGVQFVHDLKREYPDVHVVGFCHHMETDLIRRAKNARADVVVPRLKFEELFTKMVEQARPDAGAGE